MADREKPSCDELERRLARSEARAGHLQRVLSATRGVNRLLVQERDPQGLIKGACATLTETPGYHNAWIALLNEEGTVVTATASSGFDGAFGLLEARLEAGAFPGCMQKVLFRESPAMVVDPPSNCRDCPLAGSYAGRAGLTCRLDFNGRLMGILCVSAPGGYAGDPEELALFNDLANDLAFALHRAGVDTELHRLNRIIQTVPRPMSFVSRDHRYLAVNDVYCEFFDLPRERILNRPVGELMGEAAYEEEVRPMLDRCLAGEAVHYEVRIDYPSKGPRWMATDYFPVRNQRGEVEGVAVHGMDVTEQRQAQEALRESRANLFALIENTDGMIWSVDRSYGLLAANSVFHEEMRKVRGRPLAPGESILADGFPAEEISQWRAHYDRALQGERFSVEVERRLLHAKQTLIFRFNPIRAPDGSVTGVAVYGRDITRQKQAQDRLKAYSRELEERVEERARALREAQRELLQQEKLATIGQLAGGVAHELRNPLGAVKNAAYFLDMVLGPGDEAVQETLEILNREVANAENIIQGLFTCADPKPPRKVPGVDLNACLEGVLARMTLPDGIAVVLDLDRTLPRCTADPDQLDQVARNLVQNAVQAMGGSGRLTLSSRRAEPGRVAFSVEDTGEGMDAEQLKRIFRPLFTTRAKGIGLGLALCKTYVEAHDGAIEVESAKTRGSRFTVTLPIEGHPRG